MESPVDDEHRAGLRGEPRFRPIGEKPFRLEDARFAIADKEHAVRLFIEVWYLAGRAGARAGVGAGQFAAMLDMEADRSEVGLVHAAIHGKLQRLALSFEP